MSFVNICDVLQSKAFQIATAFAVSTVLFSALIIYVSKHPQKRTLPLKAAFILMFIGGMIIYCSCNYLLIERAKGMPAPEEKFEWVKGDYASLFEIPYVVVRSVMDVGIMFYGRDNSGVFYALDIAKKPWAVFLFWLMHLIAFYVTASALIIRFGKDLLRWVRIKTSGFLNINLIYGINPDTLALGRNIADDDENMLVYIDEIISEDCGNAIREMGGVAYSDKDALNANKAFLKYIRLKPLKNNLTLYALSSDYDKNFNYARIMLENLKNLGIRPEQTKLKLLGIDEWKGMNFQAQALNNKYGYGDVISFEELEMSARVLINKYPVCNVINFDKDGRAIEDVNVLIVGFGRIGHEVLRKIIANGQFAGSNFKATIYDPDYERRTGFTKSQYPMMFANYDINFEPQDGRSDDIFKFLKENAAGLKYIVICLKDRDKARDIAIRMVDRLQAMGYSLNVYTCDRESIRCYSQYARECQTHYIYQTDLIYSGKIDYYAKELNNRYCGGGDEDLDLNWHKCGYFDRMSSRAAVDYLVPLVKRLEGKFKGGEISARQRENLAESEHLRWCAFHYTFGFDAMERDEFIERVKNYKAELKKFGKSNIKISKDMQTKRHVCLVEWDELDEISRLENSMTNGNKDYKDFDRQNIDMIMQLMNDGNNGE